MQTHELLFELSHPVRFQILRLLSESPLRLTKIGEQVDANNPEVSRHLDRLKKSELVGKDPDGYYSTTSFGKTIMSMLPGVSFVASHPRYFLDHDLSRLPESFVNRLGELMICSFTEGTINNIGISTKMVQEAEERIFLVTREIPRDSNTFHERGMNGLDLRVVRHEDTVVDCDTEGCHDQEMRDHLRIVKELPAILVLTEKEAAVMFPNHKGAFDFAAGFNSTDPTFIGWCEDLCEYLWKTGSTLDEIQD